MELNVARTRAIVRFVIEHVDDQGTFAGLGNVHTDVVGFDEAVSDLSHLRLFDDSGDQVPAEWVVLKLGRCSKRHHPHDGNHAAHARFVNG
jgi:hypothetical protein